MPPADSNIQKPPATPVGPTAGIVIIVLMLMLGAIYFLVQQVQNKRNAPSPAYIPGDQT